MVLGEVRKGRVTNVKCTRAFSIPKAYSPEKKTLPESYQPGGRSFPRHDPPYSLSVLPKRRKNK